MVVKINKQKLIIEEVEQFDNISIEDLAEGATPYFSMRYIKLDIVYDR